jgi:hypothetical protein
MRDSFEEAGMATAETFPLTEPPFENEEWRRDSQAVRIVNLADRSLINRWIDRRADDISFLDERSYRHKLHIHVDLEKLGDTLPERIGHPETILLPILRLSRTQHVQLSVSSGHIGELGRMTIDRERDVVIRWLSQKWKDRIPDEALAYAIELISSDAREAWLARRPGPSQELPLHKLIHLVNLLSCQSADGLPTITSPREELADFLGDVEGWYSEYLVIIEFPKSALRTNNQALIVIEYIEGAPRSRFPALRRRLEAGESRWAWFRRLCAVSTPPFVGWVLAGSYSIPVRIRMRSNIGTARSSDVGFRAPPGFRAIDAKVMVDYGVNPRLRIEYPDDELAPEHAHVHVPDKRIRIHSAEFRVSLLANKSGFPVQSMIASWLLVALAAMARHKLGLLSSGGITDPETFILIFVPVVVAIVTQQDGQRPRSRCFNFSRALLAASALSVLESTAFVVFQMHGIVNSWDVTLGITAAVSTRLTLSFLNQWKKTAHRAAVRGREVAIRAMMSQLEQLDELHTDVDNPEFSLDEPSLADKVQPWELWPLAESADAPVVLGRQVLRRVLVDMLKIEAKGGSNDHLFSATDKMFCSEFASEARALLNESSSATEVDVHGKC